LEKPLDQAGVTVIDFQNNGSPGAFVGLARAFEIPWIMVCDNDDEGRKFIKQVKDRGLTDGEINELVRPLEDGFDFELFLVKNGFIQEYIQILTEQRVSLTKKEGDEGFEDEIALMIRKDKTGYANALIEKLRTAGADKSRVPHFFEVAIKDIIKKASTT